MIPNQRHSMVNPWAGLCTSTHIAAYFAMLGQGVELAPTLDCEMPTPGDHRLNTVIRQILPPLREIFCCAKDVRLTSTISSVPLIRGYDCMLDALSCLVVVFLNTFMSHYFASTHCRTSGLDNATTYALNLRSSLFGNPRIRMSASRSLAFSRDETRPNCGSLLFGSHARSARPSEAEGRSRPWRDLGLVVEASRGGFPSTADGKGEESTHPLALSDYRAAGDLRQGPGRAAGSRAYAVCR